MEHVEYTYTAGMDEETLDERLASAETGVLALADADDAYGVPLAYYYDGGGAILFRLGAFEGSDKIAFVESTDRACFVVYGYDSPRESWSVLITGRLARVPDGDERYDDAEINRHFPDLRVFDEDIAEVDIRLYELEIDTITGRETFEE